MDKNEAKQKLMDETRVSITKMFENILTFAEIMCADRRLYDSIRIKTLRFGNNAIRNVEKNLGNYEVLYKEEV